MNKYEHFTRYILLPKLNSGLFPGSVYLDPNIGVEILCPFNTTGEPCISRTWAEMQALGGGFYSRQYACDGVTAYRHKIRLASSSTLNTHKYCRVHMNPNPMAFAFWVNNAADTATVWPTVKDILIG